MLSRLRPLHWILFWCLGLQACATPRGGGIPTDAIAPANDPDLETVVIFGLNDFHGAILPSSMKSQEQTVYERGGAPNLAAHLKILRKELGSRLLVLDAGDSFQGTLVSEASQGQATVALFNQLGVQAVGVGDGELDWLASRAPEARFPFVLSNLRAGSELAASTQSSTLITAGRLQVGVIGLLAPELGRGRVELEPWRESALREAKTLRARGADLVVALAHSGLSCELGRAQAQAGFRRPSDPLGACDESSRLSALLQELPRGTIDAVISGHAHRLVHHWIRGVPVIQAGADGLYYNLIYLSYDLKSRRLLPERTRIEGSVPVCTRVFENQLDCNGSRPAPRNGRGNLVRPVLHGRTLTPDDAILGPILDPLEQARQVGEKRISVAARPLGFSRTSESELGNLAADALRHGFQADVALLGSGSVRGPIEAGPVTYASLYRAFPFASRSVVLKLKGRDLSLLLRIAENGARGYFPTSGLLLKLLTPSGEPTSSDLDGNGKIDLWEVDRLVEARLANGDPIEPDGEYRVATLEFLSSGGDDLGWFMSHHSASRGESGPGLRDLVAAYLESKSQPLNSPDSPLVDLEKPRAKYVESRPKSKSRKAVRRKKRRRR